MDNNFSTNNNNETINLRDLLSKYLRKWYWFVFAVIIAIIIAAFYIKMTDTKYQVQTTILLRNDENSNAFSQMAMMESFGFAGVSKEVEDEIQVIRSYKIIKQAIDSLGLYTEYYQRDGLKYVEKYDILPFKLVLPDQFCDTLRFPIEMILKENSGKYSVKFKYGTDIEGKYELSNLQEPFNTPAGRMTFQTIAAHAPIGKYKIIVYPTKQLVANYYGKLNVGAVNKKSNAIQISIVESNIKKAEAILNKVVELYNLDAIIDKNIIATNTAKFIAERLIIITKELFDVESDVENYKKSNGLTDISSEAEIYLKSSSEYEIKIADLETQLNLIQHIESYIRNNKNQYDLIPANIGIEDKTLVELIQSYNLALLERMKLIRTTNESNPRLTQLEQQISALRSNLLASIASVKSGFQIAKNDVIRKDAQFNSRIKAVPTQERQFLEIKRQQEIKQNLYLFLSQKREENALSLASTAPAARTVDKAYASLTPVAPKVAIIYMVALILGLLFPFLYIYLRDLVNNKIEDVKEFQKLIKAPYLGSISTSREVERVVVREGVTTPIAEMFRLIRTNLQFMIGDKKSPVIIITSSVSGEGKSFSSINISMSLALMKKKVILVGLDIRNPMLGEYLHIPKDKGVTIFLSSSECQVKDIIHPSGFHDYLDVIPAGPVPPNPAELLMSQRLEELVADLKTKYDYIVFDSAPIGVVSDTYLLNRVADNCIYIARQNYTPREASNLINEVYHEKKLNNMGVVLNGTPASSAYGYHYGYTDRYRSRETFKVTLGDRINDLFNKIFKRN